MLDKWAKKSDYPGAKRGPKPGAVQKRSMERIKMSGMPGKAGKMPKDWRHWDIDKVVQHSVRLVAKYMDDEEISKEKRLECATKFALKIIPEQHFVETRHSLSHEDRMLLRERLDKLLITKADIEIVKIDQGDNYEENASDTREGEDSVTRADIEE